MKHLIISTNLEAEPKREHTIQFVKKKLYYARVAAVKKAALGSNCLVDVVLFIVEVHSKI